MSDLEQRLRGHYSITIRDGGGPIDGKDVFERDFAVPPIQIEAANEITRLRAELDKAKATINRCVLGDLPGDCYAAEVVTLRAAHAEAERSAFNAAIEAAAKIADYGAPEGPVFCRQPRCVAAAIRALKRGEGE